MAALVVRRDEGSEWRKVVADIQKVTDQFRSGDAISFRDADERAIQGYVDLCRRAGVCPVRVVCVGRDSLVCGSGVLFLGPSGLWLATHPTVVQDDAWTDCSVQCDIKNPDFEGCSFELRRHQISATYRSPSFVCFDISVPCPTVPKAIDHVPLLSYTFGAERTHAVFFHCPYGGSLHAQRCHVEKERSSYVVHNGRCGPASVGGIVVALPPSIGLGAVLDGSEGEDILRSRLFFRSLNDALRAHASSTKEQHVFDLSGAIISSTLRPHERDAPVRELLTLAETDSTAAFFAKAGMIGPRSIHSIASEDPDILETRSMASSPAPTLPIGLDINDLSFGNRCALSSELQHLLTRLRFTADMDQLTMLIQPLFDREVRVVSCEGDIVIEGPNSRYDAGCRLLAASTGRDIRVIPRVLRTRGDPACNVLAEVARRIGDDELLAEACALLEPTPTTCLSNVHLRDELFAIPGLGIWSKRFIPLHRINECIERLMITSYNERYAFLVRCVGVPDSIVDQFFDACGVFDDDHDMVDTFCTWVSDVEDTDRVLYADTAREMLGILTAPAFPYPDGRVVLPPSSNGVSRFSIRAVNTEISADLWRQTRAEANETLLSKTSDIRFEPQDGKTWLFHATFSDARSIVRRGFRTSSTFHEFGQMCYFSERFIDNLDFIRLRVVRARDNGYRDTIVCSVLASLVPTDLVQPNREFIDAGDDWKHFCANFLHDKGSGVQDIALHCVRGPVVADKRFVKRSGSLEVAVTRCTALRMGEEYVMQRALKEAPLVAAWDSIALILSFKFPGIRAGAGAGAGTSGAR